MSTDPWTELSEAQIELKEAAARLSNVQDRRDQAIRVLVVGGQSYASIAGMLGITPAQVTAATRRAAGLDPEGPE